MAAEPSKAPKSLRLTWPTFIHYHSDRTTDAEADDRDASHNPAHQSSRSSPDRESYNGVPLEYLGEAQSLGEDEFRLLDLHSGEPGTGLFGALRKVSLSGHDVYEPLSYTWDNHPTDVTVNDEDIFEYLFIPGPVGKKVGCLRLQTNCARALYRIRNESKDSPPRSVWVDSVCI